MTVASHAMITSGSTEGPDGQDSLGRSKQLVGQRRQTSLGQRINSATILSESGVGVLPRE